MNVINTLDLAQKLQARTSFSERDAAGIIQTVAEAVDGATSSLVTRDQLDARFAEMDARFSELRADVRTDIAKLKTKIAELKADIQVALRSQMTTIIGSMAAIGGLIVALVKLL